MLQNFEISILNRRDDEYVSFNGGMFPRTVESFNLEFSAVSYYYFLKLKKIKIPNCTRINLQIRNLKT